MNPEIQQIAGDAYLKNMPIACGVGDNDDVLWFERGIEGDTSRYSGFWQKNEEKIGQKMTNFDFNFWLFHRCEKPLTIYNKIWLLID